MSDRIRIELPEGEGVYDAIWKALAAYRAKAHKQPSSILIPKDVELRLFQEATVSTVGFDLVAKISEDGRRALPTLYGVPTIWDAEVLEFMP